MTLFTYNDNVPATNNNPSADQPLMLINTQSIKGILAIDHITLDANNGGTHKQITFISKNIPGGQTDPTSTLYTNDGDKSTFAEVYFKNQGGAPLLISAIKAFGSFIMTAGNTSFINGYNVSLAIVGTTATITITTGATAAGSSDYVVIPVINANETLTTAITSATTFTLATGAGGGGAVVSFIVLQA